MELSHDALIGFRTRFSTLFNRALNLAQPAIEKVALRVDSGRVELVNHRWMRGIPGVREFIGARYYNNLGTDGFVVKNKKWENTIVIKREDLERDQFGIYEPWVSRMGQSVMLHRDVLGFGLLSQALSDPSIKSYDGIAFYGNHNVDRKKSFNNKSSANLNEISLQTAIQELRNRRDSEGNKLMAASSKPLLIVPPALEFTARKLANASFIVQTAPGSGAPSATNQAAQAENVLQGMFDLHVEPLLATDKEWHLTIQDQVFKPLVFQVESDIEFLGYEKFLHRWSDNDEFVIGTRALYNVAVGLPEMCYGSTGT
jgi:phage major head subunit gpT-like protein